MSHARGMILGAVAVAALLALTVPNLESQGPYYDELHQAPSAFHYVGKHPALFTWIFHGIPVFNMTYSGAIKSTVYGMYLRYVNPHFTVFSWRMLGILMAASGLILFYFTIGHRLSWTSGILFGMLILTDSTIILTTRHDWGPTALALGLRLAFLAAWLSIEIGTPSMLKYGIAGFLTGLAVFEKLSSVVLIAALLILLVSSFKANRRNWIAGVSGLFAGMMPLILANVSYYRGTRTLISLSGVDGSRGPFHLADMYSYGFQLLALGQGVLARSLILDETTNTFFGGFEAGLMLLLLLTVSAAAWQFRRESGLLTLAGVMAGTYAVVGVLIFLLPRMTYIHHWIVATPFQYCAIALALPAVSKQIRCRSTFFYRSVLTSALAVLFAMRVVNLAAIESSLTSGKASAGFASSFNRLASIGADKARDSVFVASDWGSATQAYCGVNGEDDSVYEPFWDKNPAENVLRIAQETKKRSMYVLSTHLAPEFDDASASILNAMGSAPGWQETPVETEFRGIEPIRVRKFIRSADRFTDSK